MNLHDKIHRHRVERQIQLIEGKTRELVQGLMILKATLGLTDNSFRFTDREARTIVTMSKIKEVQIGAKEE